MSAEPYDERTTKAIVEFLEASKHRVHRGAAKSVAEHFLPDGRIAEAERIAQDNGWPVEAVLAGLRLT